jgi:large subunit ribosomal protein L15
VYYKPVKLKDLATFEFEHVDVTPEVMAVLGLIKKETDPVVILGEGEINEALTIKAHRFSKSAKEKIEAVGGTVQVIPYSK